jgi:hypothetical protein
MLISVDPGEIERRKNARVATVSHRRAFRYSGMNVVPTLPQMLPRTPFPPSYAGIRDKSGSSISFPVEHTPVKIFLIASRAAGHLMRT